MKKKDIFYSTRKLTGPYQFLIEASKIHSEKILKNKMEYKFEKKKLFNLKIILLIIKIILESNFFDKKKIMNIKYKGYNISRYAVPEIYKNYNTYLNFYSFFTEAIKVFYFNFMTLEHILKIDKKNIKAAFIDHGMYRNGLVISVLAKKKIPIYTLGYPKGIFFFIDGKKKHLNYEDIIELKKKNALKKIEIKESIKAIKNVINKTETIPWMKSIKFKKEKKNYNNITHLIYAHTFTDAQMLYGYDGFINVFDWLEFTVKELSKNKNNKILIKAHPGFFHLKFPTKNMIYDRKLFYKIISHYSDNDNIIIIKDPIKNGDLLKKLNKKTILISHHGSAILEGLFLGFKFIASRCSFWSPKFKLTNDWHSKKKYKFLLNQNWKKLKSHNQNDLYNVCFQLFCNKLSLYGKRYWQQIMSEELKINRKKIYEESAFIFDKISLSSQRKYSISNKISKTIEKVLI